MRKDIQYKYKSLNIIYYIVIMKFTYKVELLLIKRHKKRYIEIFKYLQKINFYMRKDV